MVNSCGITTEEEKASVCTGNILMKETLFILLDWLVKLKRDWEVQSTCYCETDLDLAVLNNIYIDCLSVSGIPIMPKFNPPEPMSFDAPAK